MRYDMTWAAILRDALSVIFELEKISMAIATEYLLDIPPLMHAVVAYM